MANPIVPVPGNDFPDFADRNVCDTFVNNLAGHMHMSVLNTTLESLLYGVHANPALLARMRREDISKEQKQSMASAWIGEHLLYAAPRREAIWLMNRRTIIALKQEIMLPAYTPMVTAFQTRFNSEDTLVTDIEMYGNLSRQFRTNVSDHLPYIGFRDLNHVIANELMVSRENLGQLNDMLTEIVRKRRERLGGQDGMNRGVAGGQGAQHYNMYIDYILDATEERAMMSLTKRTKGNNGILAQGEVAEMGADGQAKRGYLLLSTALRTYLNGNPEASVEDFAADVRPAMVNAVAEVRAMAEANANEQVVNAEYQQQCANIDILFNFYLTLRSNGILISAAAGLTVAEWRAMRRINLGLYAIGQRLLGRKKVIEIITAAGGPLQTLMMRTNETGSITMPPFACTYKRIYDFVAVFGVVKHNEMQRTFFESGISPRYFVHFNLGSNVAMQIVTYYWSCLQAINAEDGEDKNEAEHYFHQLMINKISGYTNTTNKAGNVFGMILRQAPGGAVPHVQQPNVAQMRAMAAVEPVAEDEVVVPAAN